MDESSLKGRSRLYDITALDGTSLANAVTIQEASDLTRLSKACIRQAAILGHRAGRKYHVKVVDAILDNALDADLFAEWNEVRMQLLKYGRKKEKWEK